MQVPEVNIFTSDYLNNVLQQRKHPVDRLLADHLQLPYRFDQIRIQPNDDATAQTFNLSMDRLYDNFLYLVSNTKMSPPLDRQYWERLRLARKHMTSHVNSRWSDAFVDTESSHRKTQIDLLLRQDQNNKWYSIAIEESGGNYQLRMWSEHLSNIHKNTPSGYIHTSEWVDDNQSKKFINLVQVCNDNEHGVYVLDAGDVTTGKGAAVFRYDITGMLSNDPIMNADERVTKGRELHKYVGGVIKDDVNVHDKEQFLKPKCMISDGEHVYVVDVGVTDDHKEVVVVKKFDSRLNWVANHSLLNIDTRPTPESYHAQFNDMILFNDRFLVLSGHRLIQYDTQFNYIEEYDLTRSYEDVQQPHKTDRPLYLKPSLVNPNILYVVRETHIEKVYYTRLDTNIRSYKIYNSAPNDTLWSNFKWVESNVKKKTVNHTDSIIRNRGDVVIYQHPRLTTYIDELPGDTVLVKLNTNNGRQRQRSYLWVENEQSLRQALLYENFDHMIHTIEQTRVHPDESIDNFVYNKSISKMLYNMQMLIQSMVGQFAIRGEQVKVDEKDNVEYIPPTYEGVHYSIDSDMINDGYQVTLDNFLHVTEPFVNGVFNRCLYELYKLQQHLLDVLQVKWVYEPNVFELGDILSLPCPGGIKTDGDRSTITDDTLCIVPDDDNDKVDICSLYALQTKHDGSLVDGNGQCIIYGVKGG